MIDPSHREMGFGQRMQKAEEVALSDEVTTPTFLDHPHAFSIDTSIPHSRRLDMTNQAVQTSGAWSERRLRGTATRFLTSSESGARICVSFAGRAASMLLPMDFVPPGPRYGTLGGALRCRIDRGDWVDIPSDRGREVLVGSGLSVGDHVLEIECGDVDSGPCGIEAIRTWDVAPGTIFGQIDGGPQLTDLRADVSGPVSFSRTIRNARTGFFSLLLPFPGVYQIDLHAMGWERHSFRVEIATPGQVVRLSDIALSPLEPSPTQPRELDDNEPLILVCFAHVNIWGQEAAEWLARRVDWINDQKPHVVLDANEVNPLYVAGALRTLHCPWLACSGNHSMAGFDEALPAAHRALTLAPARFLTAGKEVQEDMAWEGVLSQFTERDKLRILCSYEPYAPAALLERRRVRFFFYGHSLKESCYWNREGTAFLRKVDANTFYRVEIGPPHDFTAPVSIQRFIFEREV
jgi:hypothetical protein